MRGCELVDCTLGAHEVLFFERHCRLLESVGKTVKQAADGLVDQQHGAWRHQYLAEQQADTGTDQNIDQPRYTCDLRSHSENQNRRDARLDGNCRSHAERGRQHHGDERHYACVEDRNRFRQEQRKFSHQHASRDADHHPYRLLAMVGQVRCQTDHGRDHGKDRFRLPQRQLADQPRDTACKGRDQGVTPTYRPLLNDLTRALPHRSLHLLIGSYLWQRSSASRLEETFI